MENPPKTICVIPARAGSKRVPKKNIREFMGQPLLVWSIKAALRSQVIHKVIVSTDDPAAIDIASDYGVEVCNRPVTLAGDYASTFDVLKHVYTVDCVERGWNPEILVLLQVTSPLREIKLIDEGVAKLASDDNMDRLVELNQLTLASGKISGGYWTCDFPEDTRSQELPVISFPSGRLFIYRTNSTIAKNTETGSRTGFIIGDYEKNINIDHESDFQKLEFVYRFNSSDYRHLLN